MAIELFGLDIGNNSLKIAYAERRGNDFSLTSAKSVKSNPELLNYNSPQNVDAIVKLIQDLHRSSGIRTRNMVMAVPEEQVYSRLISLPELKNDDELDEALHYSLKPLIPLPIESVYISKLLIDSDKRNGKIYNNWYVVAAPVTTITSIQNLVQKSGFKLLAVETEAIASSRFIHQNYKDETDVMIVDIGADSTNIILQRKGNIVFSQTISTGSSSLTKALEADFSIDTNKAEELKLTYGLNTQVEEGKIANSLIPIIDIIVSDISRSITYYNDKLSSNSLTKIYLTGGGSHLIELDSYINQKLNIQVVKTDGTNLIRFPKGFAENEIGSFNVAAGLALKGYLDVT